MVIWLIGLSGAGKSTIGVRVADQLRELGPNVVYLDGDELRDVWGDRLGHDIKGRGINAARISHLCRMLDRQGIHVVAAVLSIFPDWQAWNRREFSRYFEVFLDAPMDLVIKRDSKGLYRQALAGEIKDVVGVDIAFPRPANPDLTFAAGDLEADADVLARRIVEQADPFRRTQ